MKALHHLKVNYGLECVRGKKFEYFIEGYKVIRCSVLRKRHLLNVKSKCLSYQFWRSLILCKKWEIKKKNRTTP